MLMKNFSNIPMRECIIFENLDESGIVKFPLCTANELSPKGNVKKHNL